MKGDEHPWLWKQGTVLLSTWLQVLHICQGHTRLSQLQISPVLGTWLMNCDHCWSGASSGPWAGSRSLPWAGQPLLDVLSSKGMLHCLCSPQHSTTAPLSLLEPLFILHFTGTDPEGWGWNLHCWNVGKSNFSPL